MARDESYEPWKEADADFQKLKVGASLETHSGSGYPIAANQDQDQDEDETHSGSDSQHRVAADHRSHDGGAAEGKEIAQSVVAQIFSSDAAN